jgi:hypothetical protein
MTRAVIGDLIEQYNLEDLKVNSSVNPDKEIIHITLRESMSTKEIKILLEKVLGDLYKNTFIKSATVLVQKGDNSVFVDMSVILSNTTSTNNKRSRPYHLKDIWMHKGIKREGQFIHKIYSSPYFYNSPQGSSNQLLIYVSTSDSYNYVITSAIEVRDKGTSCYITQRAFDKPLPQAGVIDFFHKTINLEALYSTSINMLNANDPDRLEQPNGISTELWEAHKQYIHQ